MTNDDWVALEVEMRLREVASADFVRDLISALKTHEEVSPGFTAQFLKEWKWG